MLALERRIDNDEGVIWMQATSSDVLSLDLGE
jgi:hypothetical protein